jgi:hypothetical protein
MFRKLPLRLLSVSWGCTEKHFFIIQALLKGGFDALSAQNIDVNCGTYP